MDLGDHGSHYVAGSSRYLLSWPFSLIHAASQPSNMLHTLILGPTKADCGWWEEKSHCVNLPHTHLQPVTAATPSKEHATEEVKL